jgi:HAD superfamily hydrolase (TIGR01509 family)
MSGMQQPENRLRREAVLFDLDGVIVSSEVQKSEAHVETVVHLGGTPSKKLTGLYIDVIGLSYEETRDKFLACGKIVPTPEIKEAYRGIYRTIYRSKIEDMKLAPGAQQLLTILSSRRYRIGLVSSAHPEEVTTILRKNQVEHFFQAVVTADSVKNHKPAPDPYRKALELLRLEQTPNLAVAFEDTWTGIVAAKAAQLKVFAVRHRLNHKQNLNEAERIFHSLEDDQIILIVEEYLNH